MLACRLEEFQSPGVIEETKGESPRQYTLPIQQSLLTMRSRGPSGLSSQNSSESLTPMTPHSLSHGSLQASVQKLQPGIRHDLKDPRNQLGLIERLKEIKEQIDSSSDEDLQLMIE